MLQSQFKGISINNNLYFKISNFLIPKCYDGDLKAVLIPEGMIADRIKSLAEEIHLEIKDQEIIMLCVLKGSYRFFNKLLKEISLLRLKCETKLFVEFIRVKSYKNMHSIDNIEIIGFSDLNKFHKKNVLIIEDMIDTGKTLSQLLFKLKSVSANQIWTCLLLSKRTNRAIELNENFVAFNIPNIFVVGYGLDYNEKFRELNHICIISEEGIEKYKK